MHGNETIRIGTPVASDAGGRARVSADVDGVAVWFESADLPLAPSPEAFASAFLLPSLAHRRRLISEAPLDPIWLENIPALIEVFHRWWRYRRLVPAVAAPPGPGVGSPAAPDPGPVAAQRGRGLFFSGGVDSFHALLCCGESIDRLVFVEGFDMALGDARRVESALSSLRDVAAEVGVELTLVRTNLRDHPLMRATSWERANGGALAAAAHVLGGSVQEMLIASSIAVQWKKPWGSHWQTDPLFSSSRVRIREVGHELRRIEKVRRIADRSLVQRHLRVCWENRSSTGNCSRCGKCVITRLMLADCGQLDRYPPFEGTATLARDVDALRSDSHRHSLTDIVARGNLDPELRRAAEGLLARVRHAESLPVRMRRAAIRNLLEWVGAVPRARS
jgi:hypothetical protein